MHANAIRILAVGAILLAYGALTWVVEEMEENRDPSIARLPSFKFAMSRRDDILDGEFKEEPTP